MNTLIVGGEGGIGGAMINSLEGNKAGGVNYATSRRIKTSPQKTTTKWITLDLASKRSIHAATDQLKETCSTLDLVVFASGYLHGENGNPEKTIKDIESSSMIHSYLVNTIGPIIFFQNCLPLIKSAKRPLVIFLSAQVGSIEDNRTGGWYSYRMAKAALNMAVKSLALECSRMQNQPTVVAVHPGTTTTKLSQPFLKHRKVTPRGPIDTASAILELAQEITPADSGKFFKTSGETIPW